MYQQGHDLRLQLDRVVAKAQLVGSRMNPVRTD
jgi:hypothetical protein